MDQSGRIRASIIGITGYTGLETLRLLTAHPHVQIVHLTSRTHDDAAIGDVYPHLSHLPYRVRYLSAAEVAKDSDVVFLALPHKTAMEAVPEMIGKTKIIDLSADFRLRDVAQYEATYGTAHSCPDLIPRFVYGVPEFDRAAVVMAENIANPGCFALLAQLMLRPLRDLMLSAQLMAVTGSSGSGKTPSEGTHHPVRDHNMVSYNINAHRHIPEILVTSGLTRESLSFVPTSGPFVRGIFATAFVQLKTSAKIDAQKFYADAPFVRVRDTVALAHVAGSNFCDLSYRAGPNNTLIVQGALDNIVKGSGGNAIHCMNLMFGLPETACLNMFQPVYL